MYSSFLAHSKTVIKTAPAFHNYSFLSYLHKTEQNKNLGRKREKTSGGRAPARRRDSVCDRETQTRDEKHGRQRGSRTVSARREEPGKEQQKEQALIT